MGFEFGRFRQSPPVDFNHRQLMQAKLDATPKEFITNWRSGVTKMFMLQTGMRVRLDHKDLFAKGDYVPLAVEGLAAENVIAFARTLDKRAAIIVVPRLALDFLRERDKIRFWHIADLILNAEHLVLQGKRTTLDLSPCVVCAHTGRGGSIGGQA